jgi:integrase
MSSKRRDRGDGGIDERGPNSYRLRYRIQDQRYSVTFKGTLQEARKEVRRLLRSGDTGEHVAPDKITVGQWIEQWLAIGAPGRLQKRVTRRSLKRYSELLRGHVVPSLGPRLLQQLQATEIDALYAGLEGKISQGSARHVHDVFKSCLGTAVRSGLLSVSPMARVMKVPSPGEADHGIALDPEQLRALVEGFRGSTLYPIVCVAAFTGARRNEILALRWSDLNEPEKTLRIERAIESVHGAPLAIKGPKTERGKRTITIDDDLVR